MTVRPYFRLNKLEFAQFMCVYVAFGTRSNYTQNATHTQAHARTYSFVLNCRSIGYGLYEIITHTHAHFANPFSKVFGMLITSIAN